MCQGSLFHKWSDWIYPPSNATEAIDKFGMAIAPIESKLFDRWIEKVRICCKCSNVQVRYIPDGH